MNSTFEELAAFIAVVDTGSITAAATRLEQTVSGVSRTLNRLEQKLRTTLLRRTTRRLELTEEGAVFLSRARQIVAALNEAEELMALRRDEPQGRLRVNAAAPVISHVVVPMVPAFRARYPKVELELNTSDHIIDLLEQRTDVAIRVGTLPDSSLRARLLGSFRLRLVASPAYLAVYGVPVRVEDLAKHTLLGFSMPQGLNEWPLVAEDGTRLRVDPAISASSGDTLLQLALGGTGIACLSDFVTAQGLAGGALVALMADATIDMRRVVNAVYYRHTALSSRMSCFLDFLAEHVKRLEEDLPLR